MEQRPMSPGSMILGLLAAGILAWLVIRFIL